MGGWSEGVPRHMVEGSPSVFPCQGKLKKSSSLQATQGLGDTRQVVAEDAGFRLDMGGARAMTPLVIDKGAAMPP